MTKHYRYEIRHNPTRARGLKLWYVFDSKYQRVLFDSDDDTECHRYAQELVEDYRSRA